METTILREEESVKNEKGYQIIIKNLDNGEEVVNEKTRAIIGAYQTETPEGKEGVSVQSITVTSCNTATLIATIETVDKVIKAIKKRVIEGVIGDSFIAALLASLGDKR